MGFVSFAAVFCALCVVCGVASPTGRRQLSPGTTSTSLPTDGAGDVWGDAAADDFDLDDDDDDWLDPSVVSSPPPLPVRSEYKEYDDDSEDSSKHRDDDLEVQDAEEDDDDDNEEAGDEPQGRRDEFLFPASERRLVLKDDDADQSGLIRVRHTGKPSYQEIQSNSLEDDDSPSAKDDGQFEFGDDEDDKTSDDQDGLIRDDFILEDTGSRDGDEGPQTGDDSQSDKDIPKQATRNEEGDDDDDDEEDDDPVFESPEDNSRVVYGDHVFLY